MFSAEVLENGMALFTQDRNAVAGDQQDNLILTTGGRDKALQKGGDDVALMGAGADRGRGPTGQTLFRWTQTLMSGAAAMT